MLLKDRRSMHHRVAAALEASSGDHPEAVAAVLARHFAEAGDDEATLTYAAMAGDAAARLYANAEAEAHYRAALDAALRSDAAPTLLRSLLRTAGHRPRARGSLRRRDREPRGDAVGGAGERGTRSWSSRPTPRSRCCTRRRRRSSTLTADGGCPRRTPSTARRLGDRAAEARALWNIVVANVYGGGDAARAVEAGEASLVDRARARRARTARVHDAGRQSRAHGQR